MEQHIELSVVNSPHVETVLHDTEGRNQLNSNLIKFPLVESQNSESTGIPGLEARERRSGKFLWKGTSSLEYPGYQSVLICFYFFLFLSIPAKSQKSLIGTSDEYKLLLHFFLLQFR